MRSRRQILRNVSSLALLPLASRPAFGQGQAQRVFWGGLGFSVPAADIKIRFPMVDGAINQLGGFPVLVKAVVDQLRKNYAAGVEDIGLIGPNDDPGLLFNISLDYEQLFAVPSIDIPGKDIQVSFVYANGQVMFLKPPRQGDGDLRILYSFPFRVQSVETLTTLNRTEQEKIFARLLTSFSPNLVDTFGRYLSGKRFRESSVPRRLKVRQVSVTPEATASNTQLGILQNVGADFVGRAFSVSMAELGGYSVVPYGPSEATTRALAARFNRMPNIGDLIKELGSDEQIDIAIDLSFHRSFKILDNSNNVVNLYQYGVSFIVKATDVVNKKVVFDKKIQMIVDREIAKLLLNRARDYDQRYMVQLIVLLFDTFIFGLAKEDPLVLSKVGLDPIKDMGEVKALKALLINAKYNG
jgi:hypothetical protein